MKHMKMIRNMFGLTAVTLLALGLSGCDSKDSGGGSPGGGSGTKTHASLRRSHGSIVSSQFPAALSPYLLAQGSNTKPASPSGGSGSKTNAPQKGSGSKTNKPSGGSGLKSA